jgi:nitroreductase
VYGKGEKKMNDFMKAMDFRHACKIFDEKRRVSQEEIRYILETGRKSPSSFGMEGWKFLVVTNEALKERLRPACWNQVQITSCSHLIVILAAIDNLKPESGVPAKRFARRPISPEQVEAYIQRYGTHLARTFSSDERTYAWSARQTYIALANMMTAAAYIGIDSCPIEGFEKESVEQILGLDPKEYQVSVLLTLGYRLNEQPPRSRLSFDEVVEFIS